MQIIAPCTWRQQTITLININYEKMTRTAVFPKLHDPNLAFTLFYLDK